MGWFNFLRKNKNTEDLEFEIERQSIDKEIQARVDENGRKVALFDRTDITTIDADDYFGLYSNATYELTMAFRSKDYDKAWSLLHRIQGHKIDMAKHLEMTEKDTFAYLAEVDIGMGNVLRLEKKHNDALAHIIKAYIQSGVPEKVSNNKLPAYWKRAKLSIEDIDKAYAYIKKIQRTTGFEITEPIRLQIFEWQGLLQ